LTENYVALDILKHYLGNIHAIPEGHPEEMEPYILFGSSFPKDKEYTQVKIKVVRIEPLNRHINFIMTNTFIGM
jgi:hypothetical protein